MTRKMMLKGEFTRMGVYKLRYKKFNACVLVHVRVFEFVYEINDPEREKGREKECEGREPFFATV